MGYQNEEIEERMQERGKEYHGMLRMGCQTYTQCIPILVPHLENIRIKSVSAGHAHVMLLSDQGVLYAAGYNDRGQLGLGHRINTHDFKVIDFLANKIVLQVECGQQHNICRVIDRITSRRTILMIIRIILTTILLILLLPLLLMMTALHYHHYHHHHHHHHRVVVMYMSGETESWDSLD